MSLTRKGTLVPFMGLDKSENGEFAALIAAALRAELGRSAAKTVARWTGVSERAAKKWLAGRAVPGGKHLVVLMRHSDALWAVVMTVAGRE